MVAVVVVLVVIINTTARMSPQRALVALEGLLIATHAMVTACEEKAKLFTETPAPSPLELSRQFVSENEPMLYIADCPASVEQRGPAPFPEQGVVPTELRCYDFIYGNHKLMRIVYANKGHK